MKHYNLWSGTPVIIAAQEYGALKAFEGAMNPETKDEQIAEGHIKLIEAIDAFNSKYKLVLRKKSK